MDLHTFVRKWNAALLTERSAAQQHFRDLCEALNVPHPTQEDEIGASYTFEKRVRKAGTGEQGYADVWKRGFFAWEYKSKGGDLKKAYKQLNEYHESLDNPPLLIVCDFVRFEVHTKFQSAPTRTFAFTLDDLLKPTDTATSALPPLDVLRHAFLDYNKLRPELVAIPVTRAAAEDFLRLAQRLELERALSPERPTKQQIAHFLMRLVFCLFADSVDLLPDHTFRTLVRNHRFSPISFNRALPLLFAAMSQPDSFFGPTNIPYFNGGLFKDDATIPLDQADLSILYSAAQHDWSHIEPAIFGTLFERSLDAAKRSMIGAHYTSPEDILLLVEPVIMTPLRRRWDIVRQQALDALAAEPPLNKDGRLPAALRANRPALTILQAWAAELSSVRILDPACGSGNFLYIALKQLLDLWQQARLFANQHQLALAPEPIPSPTQLYGIEVDFYAHEIASIVVWIGFLQWKRDHAEERGPEPLLKPLTNIVHDDAIMRYDAEGKPYEPTWPEAEYIVSNPPFLGDKKMRAELNIQPNIRYVDDLRTIYKGRVPGSADLVTYWFEKARSELTDRAVRSGLIATQAIRSGANRAVLRAISSSGSIFFALSDQEWNLAGATVHIALVAFDNGTERTRSLDGHTVDFIQPNLRSGEAIAEAFELQENKDLCFIGTQKGGPFDLSPEDAEKLLRDQGNVNRKKNNEVVKSWVNARDVTGRSRHRFVIDFGISMPIEEAAQFQGPFEYLRRRVKKTRENSPDSSSRTWWRHQRPRPALRAKLARLSRYIATPMVSKHRIFVWLDKDIVAENLLVVVAREDDYFFGLLQSSISEVWARSRGSQLREASSGLRYAPESTFDTFPFPWSPGTEPSEADSPIVRAIAEAARTLVQLRDNWLNPKSPSGEPIPESDLKNRTLTKLYNERPTWLANAHRTLDEAVFAAYGWSPTLTTQEILANLLALNHQRAAAQPPKPAPKRPSKPLPPTV